MSGATRDAALTLGLLLGFTALVTTQVATLFGLVRRRWFAEALGGLLVPPLAPYWAFRRGLRGRAVVWIASAAFYLVMLLLARAP